MIYGDVLNKKVIAIPQPRLEGSMTRRLAGMYSLISWPLFGTGFSPVARHRNSIRAIKLQQDKYDCLP